jgi:ribosome-binding factor A
VSNRNKPWRDRARGAGSARGAHQRDASAELLFELALRGEDVQNHAAFDPKADRKTLQLCRQVQRALMLALAGECDDDLLRDLSVESVEPAGGAGHLLVRVNVPSSSSAGQAVARLNSRAGKLRSIVAGSICRKRVPMLSFLAVPDSGGGDHV